MIRNLIALTVALAVAFGGARVASASAGDDDVPADAASPTGPRDCAPNVLATVKAALPAATSINCFLHKTPVRFQNNRATAGTVDAIFADVALADGRTGTVELDPDGQIRSMVYAHTDLVGSKGKGMAIMFWLFAAASIAGALFVVSRKNLIAAVMGMVGSFLGIAAIYMMLYAQFLAVVQMLVYAGAIMVLFVFVVMILNRPEDEPVAPSGRAGQALGGIAILYLIGRLVMMLIEVQLPDTARALAAPVATAQGHDWGSVRAVGTDLFTGGLFPFEAISILLLVAVVGAIAIARPLHAENDAPAKIREGGAA